MGVTTRQRQRREERSSSPISNGERKKARLDDDNNNNNNKESNNDKRTILRALFLAVVPFRTTTTATNDDNSDIDWHAVQASDPLFSRKEPHELKEYYRAAGLDQIVPCWPSQGILDKQWPELLEIGTTLLAMDTGILQCLYHHPPAQRHYRNVVQGTNLKYCLQDGGSGLIGLFTNRLAEKPLRQLLQQMQQPFQAFNERLDACIRRLISDNQGKGATPASTTTTTTSSAKEQPTKERTRWTRAGFPASNRSSPASMVQYQVSAMYTTGPTAPQKPHIDFRWNDIINNKNSKTAVASKPASTPPFVGFFPLTPAGMFLQLWLRPGPGTLVFVPYGQLLIVPGSCIHGGGFTSSADGNPRGHIYIYVQEVPGEKTNTYTDPEGRPLCESYHNATLLETIGWPL
jgi:hypothetical protein